MRGYINTKTGTALGGTKIFQTFPGQNYAVKGSKKC